MGLGQLQGPLPTQFVERRSATWLKGGRGLPAPDDHRREVQILQGGREEPQVSQYSEGLPRLAG